MCIVLCVKDNKFKFSLLERIITPPFQLCLRGTMTVNGQHYCLRWNNYQSNMTSVFHQLLRNESFVDVTLACNESTLKAHKVSY